MSMIVQIKITKQVIISKTLNQSVSESEDLELMAAESRQNFD